jgi:hypothetical protein
MLWIDLWQTIRFCFNHDDQMYQVVWSRSLRSAYNVIYEVMFWPSPLTLTNNRLLFLIMVIKCTKLSDPEAYSSVSILPIWFFYLKVMLQSLTLKSYRILPFIMVIKYIKMHNPEAYGSVSTRFSYQVMLWPWPLIGFFLSTWW